MASSAPARPLTPPMEALVLAAARLGGGGQESVLQGEAVKIEGWAFPSTPHNHYSRAADALAERGFFRRVRVGQSVQWWLTDEAWRWLGHDGPAPEPSQLALL